jgi:hypothetical protein
MTPDTHLLSIIRNTAIEYSHTQLSKSRNKNVFECRAIRVNSLASAVSVLICSGALGRMRKNSTSPASNFRCTHSQPNVKWREGRMLSSSCSKSSRHNNNHNISLTITEMRECQACYCGIIRWKRMKGNSVTVSHGHYANLAFQETCPEYHAIERHVLSVGL